MPRSKLKVGPPVQDWPLAQGDGQTGTSAAVIAACTWAYGPIGAQINRGQPRSGWRCRSAPRCSGSRGSRCYRCVTLDDGCRRARAHPTMAWFICSGVAVVQQLRIRVVLGLRDTGHEVEGCFRFREVIGQGRRDGVGSPPGSC